MSRNRDGGPGESKGYREEWANEAELAEDYASIHRLTGLHGRGEILILGSSSTQGTWAAAQYVTEPGPVRELTTRSPVRGLRALPPAYRVLIRAKFKQDVPVEVASMAHRSRPPRAPAARSIEGPGGPAGAWESACMDSCTESGT